MHFSPFLSRALIQSAVFLALVFMSNASHAASACTHYASPNGTGNGLSASQPFQIANFWAVAGPGKTLCLADGTYSGDSSMIQPPSGLSGTALAPITIAALNDGKVHINGQSSRKPVALSNNDWWVLEGFNASDSNSMVISITNGSDNNILRRICAWNAKSDTNVNVWQITSINALLEDVCGFGTGRKIFSNSQRGNSAVIRRAWALWEKSTAIGPKSAFDITYNSYDSIYENVIGTWDETAMGGASIDQPKGLFSTVGPTPSATANYCTNSKILGGIGYVRSTAEVDSWLSGMFGSRSAGCFEFRNVVMNIEGHVSLRPILAQPFDGGPPSTGPVDAPAGIRQFTNVTEIGGATSSFSTAPTNGWTKINHLDVSTVPTGTANIWDGASSSGARVCKRYKNGVLTNEPLWPWPMDQRIRAALVLAGKNPDAIFGGAGKTLTDLMESMFGTIPSSCKTSTSVVNAPSIPTAASNLRVSY